MGPVERRSFRRIGVLTVGAAAGLACVAAVAAPGAGASTTLISTGPTAGGGALISGFAHASADGTRVVFESQESLVAGDTDSPNWDVYQRAGGSTTRLSTGPTGGNGAFDAFSVDAPGESADGTRVFFQTDEPLVSGDTDAQNDIYQRAAGTTSLVSTGPTGGNGAFDAEFEGASKDGTRVFFTTDESLVSGDTDSNTDLYQRSGGTTTLVSTGPNGGNGAFDARFDGTSTDGTRVFFETGESLVSGDTDSSFDVYERSGGTTTRLSTGPTGGNGADHAFFEGASADGTRVFFSTGEALVAGDTDARDDIYERAGGTTTRLSTGPSGGNGALDPEFEGASADGKRVFFQTSESLVPGDTDSRPDLYQRAGGTTTRISTGPAGGNGSDGDAGFAGASTDGTRVFFHTSEQLVGGDTDASNDVYERAGRKTKLISTGPAGGNADVHAFLKGTSADGTRAYFETTESLVSGDTDAYQDVYERAGKTTTLLSRGPSGGNGAFLAHFKGNSTDGTRVFFDTSESLAPNDVDTGQDVYEARDTTPPDTTITRHPKKVVRTSKRKVKARFAFRSSEPDSTFKCKLDRSRFKSCTSPATVKVKRGRHTFKVRAKDAAGNTDPTPDKYSWRVKRR